MAICVYYDSALIPSLDSTIWQDVQAHAAQHAAAFKQQLCLQGISAGMEPPPPAVSVLTSLMCVCLSVWTYASHGRSTAALAVSAFALLSLQLLTVKQLRFSQLASSVFGLFYCGEPWHT